MAGRLEFTDGARAPIAVAAGETVLGSGARCTARLDGAGVSERHARLRTDAGGAVYIEDLDSHSGTLKNGEFVYGRQRLADGDRVQLGGVELIFRAGAPARPASLVAGSADRTMNASELPPEVRDFLARRDAAARGEAPSAAPVVPVTAPLPQIAANLVVGAAEPEPINNRTVQMDAAEVERLMAAHAAHPSGTLNLDADEVQRRLVSDQPAGPAPLPPPPPPPGGGEARPTRPVDTLEMRAVIAHDASASGTASTAMFEQPLVPAGMSFGAYSTPAMTPSRASPDLTPTGLVDSPETRPGRAPDVTPTDLVAPLASPAAGRVVFSQPRAAAPSRRLPSPSEEPTAPGAQNPPRAPLPIEIAGTMPPLDVPGPAVLPGTPDPRAARPRDPAATMPPTVNPPAPAANHYAASIAPTAAHAYVAPKRGAFGSFSRALGFISQMFALAGRHRVLLRPIWIDLAITTPLSLLLAALLFLVSSRAGFYAVLGAGAALLYFVDYACNALAASLLFDQVTSGQARLADASGRVRRALPAIVTFAAGSALFDLAATYARERRDPVSRLLTSVLRAIWTTATYVILPLIVLERVAFPEALRRSRALMAEDPTGVGAGVVAMSLTSYLAALILFPLAWLLLRAGASLHPFVGVALFFLVVNFYWSISGWLKICYATCFYLWARECERHRTADPSLAPAPLRSALDAG